MPAFTNRFEIKYLVETEKLPRIREALSGFFDLDGNGDFHGTYVNYSVYFDSPDFRFYREKREGSLTRIKPRIRFYRPYDDAAPTGIFLELKGRHDRVVAKRRVPLDADSAECLLNEGVLGLDKRHLESSVMSEFYYLSQKFALTPCVTVVYYRTAFNGKLHQDLRMTFDREFRCSLATGSGVPAASLIPAFSPKFSIIELKYNNKVSNLLLQRLRGLGLKQQTLSKFGIAMEVGHEHMRRNLGPYRRLLGNNDEAMEPSYENVPQNAAVS